MRGSWLALRLFLGGRWPWRGPARAARPGDRLLPMARKRHRRCSVPDPRETSSRHARLRHCHAFPPPDILPRQVWRDEFVRMMFIRENRLPPLGPPAVVNRTVQLPPDMEQALPFFTSRAPERLPAPERWPDAGESPHPVHAQRD